MAMSPIIIPWIIVTGLILCTTTSFFVYSMVKKYWHEKGTPKSVRISLTVCAVFYLLANLFGFLTYIMLAVYHDHPSQAELTDPKDHSVVKPMFYLLLACYVVAILLNIYVWIERLKHVYINSAYGYPNAFIKGLKIGYITVIVLLLIIFCLFPFNDNENESAVLRTIVRVFLGLFVLVFVGETIAVSVAFIVKLKKMQGVLAKYSNDDEETFIFVQDLTHLQMKLTVLVVVQVISTLIGVLMVVPFEGEESPIGITIDAFIGFMCIYCTLATHNFAYHSACCCCIRCCGMCVKLPDKIERAKKPKVPAQAVPSHTGQPSGQASTVETTGDNTVDRTDATVDRTVDTQARRATQTETTQQQEV